MRIWDIKDNGYNMRSRLQILLKLFIIAALTWMGAATSVAQTSATEFRDILREQAAFTTDEFSALEQRGAVVKLLPVLDKREVAFCGVLRLQGTPAMLLTAFKDSLTQDKRAIRGGGKFSTPPTLKDLESLTLEQRDIEEMKRCVVGDCRLKMSAAMIKRLQREVVWSAPDHRLQAIRLFRLMLFDYVQDYLARGDAALIEYNNQAKAVRLDDEQRSLLDSLLYVNDSAPEFVSYLQSYPRLELSGVENAIHWSKIKFGLKPVIIITHTATYTRQHENGQQILAATKHLYANHYFDSSLSLTLLMNVPVNGAASETYLLYTNRSRANTFGGMFGGLTRRIVEGEVLDSLQAILQQTRQNMQTHLINQRGSVPRADNEIAGPRLWAQWLFRNMRFFLLFFLIVTGILLVWLSRRDSRRMTREY